AGLFEQNITPSTIIDDQLHRTTATPEPMTTSSQGVLTETPQRNGNLLICKETHRLNYPIWSKDHRRETTDNSSVTDTHTLTHTHTNTHTRILAHRHTLN